MAGVGVSSQAFAVVRDHRPQRPVEPPPAVEILPQAPEVEVDVADARVVRVVGSEKLLPGAEERGGHAAFRDGELVQGRVVGAALRARVDGSGQVVVGPRVGVEEMDPDEHTIALAAPPQPLGDAVDLLLGGQVVADAARSAAAEVDVVTLHEADSPGEELHGREPGHRVAGVAGHAGDRPRLLRQAIAVKHHPVLEGVQTGEDGGVGRRRLRARADDAAKQHGARKERLEERRGVARVPEAPEVIGAEGVESDEHDLLGRTRGRPGAARGHYRHDERCRQKCRDAAGARRRSTHPIRLHAPVPAFVAKQRRGERSSFRR